MPETKSPGRKRRSTTSKPDGFLSAPRSTAKTFVRASKWAQKFQQRPIWELSNCATSSSNRSTW